ncbi:putative flippase GtrA [Motilibacter rhizosphaerae]|uniref:Putative flippase GtrA n=1 Tax=Motilibacter rhizosphaerae TaxID=598652 RepID=A0A4Q7NSW3_9ACTN|nr:GtrA family protein [Motilibacter rhizosphaerae]RZS90233.1 putative flippase GtrA [Motilibacter rhizosphaerae]
MPTPGSADDGGPTSPASIRSRSPLARIYYSLGHAVRELLKFGVVGAGGVVIDVGLSNWLYSVMPHKQLTAKGIAVLVAITFNYVGNRQWTFRHRTRSQIHREYAAFFGISLVGLLITLACVAFTRYVLGYEGRLAFNVSGNVVGLALSTVFRFWAYRRFVFPVIEQAEREEEAGLPHEA